LTVKSMEHVYLVCPLSLGDYFVTNALVRHWARLSHSVTLPAVPQFMATVACLYSECSNVEVVPYLGPDLENKRIKDRDLFVINYRTIFETQSLHFMGQDHPSTVPVWWDRQIYEHFDMSYSRRYQDFVLPSHVPGAAQLSKKLNPGGDSFVLWHKHTSQHVGGVDIDLESWRPAAGLDPSLKIIQVELGHTPNLLDYIDLITHAKEIHVVPSSFHCLVDSVVDLTSAELFFHDVRKDTLIQVNSRWNNHRWHVVNYGRRQ
jgi:hypothetical protein